MQFCVVLEIPRGMSEWFKETLKNYTRMAGLIQIWLPTVAKI